MALAFSIQSGSCYPLCVAVLLIHNNFGDSPTSLFAKIARLLRRSWATQGVILDVMKNPHILEKRHPSLRSHACCNSPSRFGYLQKRYTCSFHNTICSLLKLSPYILILRKFTTPPSAEKTKFFHSPINAQMFHTKKFRPPINAPMFHTKPQFHWPPLGHSRNGNPTGHTGIMTKGVTEFI